MNRKQTPPSEARASPLWHRNRKSVLNSSGLLLLQFYLIIILMWRTPASILLSPKFQSHMANYGHPHLGVLCVAQTQRVLASTIIAPSTFHIFDKVSHPGSNASTIFLLQDPINLTSKIFLISVSYEATSCLSSPAGTSRPPCIVGWAFSSIPTTSPTLRQETFHLT